MIRLLGVKLEEYAAIMQSNKAIPAVKLGPIRVVLRDEFFKWMKKMVSGQSAGRNIEWG